jgi:hypothetical protein
LKFDLHIHWSLVPATGPTVLAIAEQLITQFNVDGSKLKFDLHIHWSLVPATGPTAFVINEQLITQLCV